MTFVQLVILLMFVAAALLFWRALHLRRLATSMETTPTSKARSASQGYVELHGRARSPSEPLRSPVSGQPCVWYSYRVFVSQRTASSRWNGVADEDVSTAPFWLNDGTGEVLVDPKGATGRMRQRKVWRIGGIHAFTNLFGPPLPARLFQYMNRYGAMTPVAIEEQFLGEGESFYAIGEFFSERAVSTRQDLIEREKILLAEWKQNKRKLKEFDTNNDGRIDQHEWDQVRQAARAQAKEELMQEDQDGPVNLLRQPESRRPFIIASYPQRDFIARCRWLSLFQMMAAFVLIVLAIGFYQHPERLERFLPVVVEGEYEGEYEGE